MARTAINVYSVRELDDTVPELIQRVADAGYDGIQFSGDHTPLDGDPAEIKATLDETGLAVTAAHAELSALEENREAVLSAYDEVGVDDLIVPYLPPECFESIEAVEETASRLEALAADLTDRGWTLQYHNHDHEFVELANGATAFETLLELTDIAIELDVGWACYAGTDPVALLDRYGDRMDHIHMKDVDTSAEWDECFTEIGNGDVDMTGCSKAAQEAGAEWLIYEHDDPENPAASVERGAEFLSSI